jgi:hypothetical protein
MAIDEIIKSFDYIKHVGNGESTYEHYREEIALNEAVAIMRKYQKIEDLYERFQKDGGYYYHMARLVDALREVLEDGNDD